MGMAYVGDIEPSKRKKDNMLGFVSKKTISILCFKQILIAYDPVSYFNLEQLVGCFVMGNSGGGIIAVLMGDVGLFAPLWVGESYHL